MALGSLFGRARGAQSRLAERLDALARNGGLEPEEVLAAARQARTLEARDLHALHRHCFEPRFLGVWAELADRFATPQVLAHWASLLRDDDPAAAIDALGDAVSREPGLWFAFGGDDWIELADELDQGASIELRIGRLRAYIEVAPESRGDEIREHYAELLDLCADDPPRRERVRALGRRIDELVAQGVVPRAFLRRTTSRD